MLRLVWAVLMVTLVGVVSPQCITPNDQLQPPPSPDLSHISPFTVGLFKELYPPGSNTGNFFFSPFSIWNALVLAYFGSAGTTRQQLGQALQLTEPADTLATYKAVDRLYAERQVDNSEYVIDLANRVYVDQQFGLPQCVREVLSEEVQNIDFSQGEAAAAIINQFVSQTTRGKIEKIVTAGDVQGSPLALVNAAYFKGLWLKPFEPKATTREKFFTTPDKHTFVDMMTQTSRFKIGDSAELGATVLEMPYKGEAVSMFVLLPDRDAVAAGSTTAPIDAMLTRLTPQTLRTALASLREQEVFLKFPKFKLEQTITDELKKALKRMGMTHIFTSSANFTKYDPSGSLVVREGIHKAVVEVNEEGAEAAAATVILVDRIISQPLPRVFTCDRPFLFIIHDNHVKNILFLGVYRQSSTET